MHWRFPHYYCCKTGILLFSTNDKVSEGTPNDCVRVPTLECIICDKKQIEVMLPRSLCSVNFMFSCLFLLLPFALSV